MADDIRFRLLGEEESRRILRDLPKTSETYYLRVRAGRRLTPKCTPEEIARNKAYMEANPRPKKEDRRLQRLRAMANKSAHRCAGYGCALMIPGPELMCFEHRVLVPDWLREHLDAARVPNAQMQWPLEMVEQAIRYTMTDGDVSFLIGQVERSHQGELLVGFS